MMKTPTDQNMHFLNFSLINWIRLESGLISIDEIIICFLLQKRYSTKDVLWLKCIYQLSRSTFNALHSFEINFHEFIRKRNCLTGTRTRQTMQHSTIRWRPRNESAVTLLLLLLVVVVVVVVLVLVAAVVVVSMVMAVIL
jgi:hypothetical protein